MATEVHELARSARSIIDANLYMTIATSDASGCPWPTPVYFASVSDREFIWVSSPEAQHSRNLVARREVGIVIFDSTAQIGTGRGVYMTGSAGLVAVDAIGRYLDVFSRSCEQRGGPPWSIDEVGPDARFRLYQATASQRWILDTHDRRIPVPFDLPGPQ